MTQNTTISDENLERNEHSLTAVKLAIVERRYADVTQKHPVKMALVGKSSFVGYFTERLLR
jgi:hypothetical protein